MISIKFSLIEKRDNLVNNYLHNRTFDFWYFLLCSFKKFLEKIEILQKKQSQ